MATSLNITSRISRNRPAPTELETALATLKAHVR
jgi:hypothetical protein